MRPAKPVLSYTVPSRSSTTVRTPFSTFFLSFIYLVCSIDNVLTQFIKAVLPALEHIEFGTALFVLHQQIEFELPVTESVLEASSLKTRVRIR